MNNPQDIENLLRALPLPELPLGSAQRLEVDFARELELAELPRWRYAVPLSAAAAVLLLALGAVVLLRGGAAPAMAQTPTVRERLCSAQLIGTSDAGRRYLVRRERELSFPTGATADISITIPETGEEIIPDEPI